MIRELFEAMIQPFKQLWCGLTRGHEYESGEIEKDTFCEVNSWCKYCDAPR